ncbi:MAG: pyridoxal phosphate-dependent aminotransferase family protein [Sporocytophaga sp.]|uniref:aminotransferase class I/II-fold pyridoxal phosphate-dependent enzyme n=1 Tax=Sporocytophaga sp. TaxID=2231183 RepID=UPI001B1A7182|nr:pyridoxal phosphate-dependent aminotransferase family protein [Sporocytophaga sp.]MBO9702460.1 pyridoxal phosphate-dependent aminotransferase family protein [Sporocytophaga sp.]
MDLFNKLTNDKGPLGKHSSVAHGYFAFPKLEGEIGPRMKFRGKEVLNWSLNNYIGLANHPEVRKADAEGAAKYGLAFPMGARMMSGNSNLIEEFEAQISDFVKKEDTMLLNFGYQGMVSIIDAVLSRHDVVIYDSESHACIVDGVRLHQGKRFVFPHNDIENLKKQLERATKIVQETKGGILVITEGVFGMAGDLGKLKEIVDLKKQYQFRLLVDDAHGFGTMGPTGAGAGEHLGVQDGIDIYFSTFAKSMASIGAFVSSTEQVIGFLRYNTRSQIFAKTLPMALVVGGMKRLELLRTQPQLRENLWNVVRNLQQGLKDAGFDIGKTESPVTPVYLKGDESEAAQLIIDLRENYSIFCSIVIYPVVPKGVLELRIIPTAMHTLEDVKQTIKAFQEVAYKLQNKLYTQKLSNISI